MMKTPTLVGNRALAIPAASTAVRSVRRDPDVAVVSHAVALVGNGATAAPRTPAGERALHRRRARLAADRRPPSGMLPSANRTAVLVRADRADEIREAQFAMGRVVRVVVAVVLMATTVLVGAALLRPADAVVVREVTVEQGDTLWSIAARVAPDADPRVEAEQIRRLNELDGDSVAVGIVLKVPTQN